MANENNVKLLKEGKPEDNRPLTEVVFILDRSGSMTGLEDDTIGGFNSMLDKQKGKDNRVLISTILFDHEIKVLHDRVPIEEVEHMTNKDYETRGTTALLDAIGTTIKHIKTIHKYAREEDRPAGTIVFITTDGYENASIKYSYADVRKLIEAQKEAGWEFVFLGANIDAIETAAQFGIDRNHAMNYHSDHIGTRKAFDAFGDAVMSFASAPPGCLCVFDPSMFEEVKKDFEERKSDR